MAANQSQHSPLLPLANLAQATTIALPLLLFC
jgi:hypothetical protein